MKDTTSLSAQIHSLIGDGQVEQAYRELQHQALQARDFSSVSQINQILTSFPKKDGLGKHLRITILHSFTIEQAIPFLRVYLLSRGLLADVQIADFNQFEQYIFKVESIEPDAHPDLLIIAARLEELAPDLVYRRLSFSKPEIDSTIHKISERIEGWIQNFRSRSKSKILLYNFGMPTNLTLSIFDVQSDWGQQDVIGELNRRLVDICHRNSDTYLLDFNRVQTMVGIHAFFDDRLWYLARQPLSRLGLQSLAEMQARMISAIFTHRKKCIVLDLDNTLWGGILGEDGVKGVQLGPDYPGNVYMDFQSALLNFYDRGFLLAINSKNNPEDVQEMLAEHPNMVLRPQQFAAIKTNWEPKPQNMREIATELNIGLDSLIYLDDSPHECELMQQSVPEVLTVQLPADILMYKEMLFNIWELDSLSYSEEDRLRNIEYQAQAKRKELESGSQNLDEFLASLDMEITILPADEFNVSRISQLTQKTNQFNLTARRYSETDIYDMIRDPNQEVYCVRVTDRFGDSGIVGVGILKAQSDSVYIDNFLLSCRVIGRRIEDAFLSFLVSQARKFPVNTIVGNYIPTSKNDQVREMYKRFGFTLAEEGNKSIRWVADLANLFIQVPDWMKINVPEK